MAGTMGAMRKDKHTWKVGVLVLVIFACAWLIPTVAAAAVSAGGATQIKVNVVDSVGVKVGRIETLGIMPVPISDRQAGGAALVVDWFVTKATLSPSKSKMPAVTPDKNGAEIIFKLPVGQAAGKVDDAVLSDASTEKVATTQVVVTVTIL